MKALHVVLLCLMILAIFSYTAVALKPQIQKDNSLTPIEKIVLYSSLKVSPRGKPSPIVLGDPIDDPIPH